MPPDDARPNRGHIFAWTLFDFANTAFSVIIVTVIYARYFTDHVAGGQRWLWGLAVSLSMIFAALLSPPLGAAADSSRNRKGYLVLFTGVSVLCTALLFFVRDGMIVAGLGLFVLANIGFEGGLVFYDAFLPSLTRRSSYGRVSGYGFAMGYLGALAVLLIVYLMLPDMSDPSYLFTVRLSFVIAALFFLVFSLPLFLVVPEPPRLVTPGGAHLRTGARQSYRTLKLLVRSLRGKGGYGALAWFLVAFFIYNDGILTVISFAAIFADHILHMNDKEIVIFFAVVQTSAILGSAVFGVVTDAIGPKRTIIITLFIWTAIAIGAYFVNSVGVFYVVALGAGIAIGSSQSASRSMMALMTPREREAEFFGFYDGLCSKASGVIGPVVYGIIADCTDERRAAVAVAAFFVVGLAILSRIPAPAEPVPSGTAAG